MDAQLRKLPIHAVTRGSCFVTGPQLLCRTKLLNHLPDRLGAVRNRSKAPHLTIRLRNSYGNRFGMDIQTLKIVTFLHDRLLPPVALNCGSYELTA